MTEGKFEQLFEEFLKIEDPAERAKISYLLFARVAAGQENKEPGIDKLEMSMGENWLAAAERFDGSLKNDPKEAFEMAIQTTMLPVSPDQKVEDINKWVRGDGPGMLGREELRSNLLEYLADDKKSATLAGKINEFFSYDFSKVKDGQSAFDDPKCYLSLSTILLGLKMRQDTGSSKNATRLVEQANMKFNDPEVKRVIDYYQELPDTKWLADELKSFEVK